MSDAAIDKNATAIRDMFAGVAPRYDLLNHVLSGSLDRLWRRRTARRAHRQSPPGPILDLCCGTGDQARALSRTGRHVVGADFCLPMLEQARGKLGSGATLALSDAMTPPFRDASFAAITVSFGVRNVADLDAALVAMRQLLAPGGKLFILEFAMPDSRSVRALYAFYFRRVLPIVARLVSGRGAAYEYLRDSVLEFPQREALARHLRDAGFYQPVWKDFSAGTVCLYTATRHDGLERLERHDGG